MKPGTFKGFYYTSKAYYAKTAFNDSEIKDEVMVGIYHESGGTSGEFAFEWIEMSHKLVPRLKAYDDSWAALTEFNGLLAVMAEVDGDNITPDEFVARLKGLGYRDLTPYEAPGRSNDYAAGGYPT